MVDADYAWKRISDALERYGLVDDRNYEATAEIFDFLLEEDLVRPLQNEEYDGSA